MQITCLNCSQTWQVSAEHLLAAKLKFALGFKEHTFVCPNCDARNVITEQEFRSHEQSDLQIPVTGTHRQTDTSTPRSHARQPGGSAPTNPVPSPDPISRQVH